METDEERKASMEKMVAIKRFRLAVETDKERKARLEKMVATTQLRLALADKKGMDLIWVDIGFFKISRNELACPVISVTKYLFNFSIQLTEQSVIVGSVTLRFYCMYTYQHHCDLVARLGELL